MPFSLSDVIIGGGKNALGKSLTNPFLLALILVAIVFLMIIFVLYKKCSLCALIKPFILSYVFVTVILFCYKDIIVDNVEKSSDVADITELQNSLLPEKLLISPNIA